MSRKYITAIRGRKDGILRSVEILKDPIPEHNCNGRYVCALLNNHIQVIDQSRVERIEQLSDEHARTALAVGLSISL